MSDEMLTPLYHISSLLYAFAPRTRVIGWGTGGMGGGLLRQPKQPTSSVKQVVNLHYILSKARVASRPSVLWCYKKEVNNEAKEIPNRARVQYWEYLS